MKLEKFRLIVSVFLILRKGKLILMLKRYKTGYQDGNYSLIAGHVDKGETAQSAIQREATEEAGIKIDLRDLKLIHVVHRVADERLDLFFTIRYWEGEPHNNEPEKCDDMQWFPWDKLPQNIASYVRKALQNIQSGVMYAEYN